MSTFRIWYDSQPVALRTLVAVNVVVYVVARLLALFGLYPVLGFALDHLALNPGLPGVLLEPWQLLTYNFMHGVDARSFGLLHVLFNMLWLFWIGKEYEQMHGPHQMLALYVIGGVGGGVLSVLGYALTASTPVIYGASASVLAVMTAVAILYPYKKIGLLFLGAVRLLYLVIGFLALDLLFMAGSNTAVLAHLGGAAAGFLFAKAQRSGVDLTSWAKVFFSGRSQSRYSPGRSAGGSSSGGSTLGGLFGAGGGGERASSRRASAGRETLREERDRKKRQRNARRAEVDRILDKISAKGYEALSDDEKRTLEDASGQG